MAVELKVDMREAPVDELAAQVATLKVSGLGINKIVEQIRSETGWPVTKTYIERRLETRETYQKTLKVLQDGIVKRNVNKYKSRTSELLDLVHSVLLNALQKGDLKAVPLVLKSVGIDLPEQEQKQAQSFTVVLPGKPKERSVVSDEGTT